MMHAKETIQLNQHQVHVIRTPRRKTLGLVINEEGIIVRAPQNVPLVDIEHLLLSKKAWLDKKVRESPKKHPLPNIENDAQLPYLGEALTLKLHHHDMLSIQRVANTLTVSLPQALATPSFLKKRLRAWYASEASSFIQSRVEHYQDLVGRTPQQVVFKWYKSRWGSCSSQGVLSFNWLLIMAPPKVIDYVVIHELCHLIEMNHSHRFWSEVARIMPDYKSAQQWLKTNGHRLYFL